MARWLVILLVAGGLALGYSAHIVRHGGGAGIVWKEQGTFERTYIDARGMGVVDYMGLPAPVRSYLADQTMEDIKEAVSATYEETKEEAGGGYKGAVDKAKGWMGK
ncbi:MAG: hypothetical protein HY804_10965 [Nitrospinae bacterium]|nr:hypothetical protein [Nitrospinota bacterium]